MACNPFLGPSSVKVQLLYLAPSTYRFFFEIIASTMPHSTPLLGGCYFILPITAGLYVFVRDVQHIYQVGLRILFFVTPIFYSISFLEENQLAHTIVMLNPLTHLIEFSRTLILEGVLFSLSHYLLVLLVNLLMVAFSLRVFRKLEPDFSAHL